MKDDFSPSIGKYTSDHGEHPILGTYGQTFHINKNLVIWCFIIYTEWPLSIGKHKREEVMVRLMILWLSFMSVSLEGGRCVAFAVASQTPFTCVLQRIRSHTYLLDVYSRKAWLYGLIWKVRTQIWKLFDFLCYEARV